MDSKWIHSGKAVFLPSYLNKLKKLSRMSLRNLRRDYLNLLVGKSAHSFGPQEFTLYLPCRCCTICTPRYLLTKRWKWCITYVELFNTARNISHINKWVVWDNYNTLLLPLLVNGFRKIWILQFTINSLPERNRPIALINYYPLYLKLCIGYIISVVYTSWADCSHR